MEHATPLVTLSPPCSHLLARFLYTHKSFCAMIVSQLFGECFFSSRRLAHVLFVKDCQPSDSIQICTTHFAVLKVVLLRLVLQLQAACILFLSITTLRCDELELTSCLASHRDQKVVVSRCRIPVGLVAFPTSLMTVASLPWPLGRLVIPHHHSSERLQNSSQVNPP